MKYIPNIISLIRMLLSLLSICFYNNILVFFIIYIICGISDILDGYIARKTNTQSIIGAKIDSAADIMMFGVIITFMLYWTGGNLKTYLPLIIVIFLIRCMNIGIAAIKFHSFITLHTWGNKLTGLLVFITPVLYILSQSPAAILPACIIAVLSAIEEGIIHIISNNVDLNRRSIFKIKEK